MSKVSTAAFGLLPAEQVDQRPSNGILATIARKPPALVPLDDDTRTTSSRHCVREATLPDVAPGQLWVLEISPEASEIPPMEHRAFASANIVIYDPVLAPLVAAALPLGGYAEPAATGDRASEFERVLRLLLDGWSVLRLVEGELTAAARTDRLRRIGEQLLDAGVAAGLAVQLLTDVAGGCEKTETCLGDLAIVLDALRIEDRLTAVFTTRRSGGVAPLYVVVDNGLAG
jgi:hypothetical protein